VNGRDAVDAIGSQPEMDRTPVNNAAQDGVQGWDALGDDPGWETGVSFGWRVLREMIL
jgi:hypothetical protein